MQAKLPLVSAMRHIPPEKPISEVQKDLLTFLSEMGRSHVFDNPETYKTSIHSSLQQFNFPIPIDLTHLIITFLPLPPIPSNIQCIETSNVHNSTIINTFKLWQKCPNGLLFKTSMNSGQQALYKKIATLTKPQEGDQKNAKKYRRYFEHMAQNKLKKRGRARAHGLSHLSFLRPDFVA